MQEVIRINSIKQRLDRLKVSLKAACDGAGVEHSTVYRWVNGDTSPRLRGYEAACSKLEAWLDREERGLLGELAARHLPDVLARAS